MSRTLLTSAVLSIAWAIAFGALPQAHAIVVVNNLEISTSFGIVNPLVIYGFNPQPDPPGVTADYRDPEHPVFTWANEAHRYEIIFGVAESGRTIAFDTPQAVPFGGNYAFSYQTSAGPGPNSFFDVFFDISTEGSLNNASWVAFNPQPDPPFDHVAFMFDVIPASPTSVSLGVRVVNRETGDAGTFSPVPEPATAALLYLAAAAACLVRKGRR